jgi:hypothetical protein
MTRTVRSLIPVALALHTLAGPVAAQPANNRSYVWLGQVVISDASRNTVTVKVPYREHINRYIGEFKPGDKVKLTWATPRPGETDALIYVGRYDPNSGKWGYVLPVEFASADTTERRLTFTMKVPPKALDTLKALPSGGWIKVTTPFDQPSETATIDKVEVSTEPRNPIS